jgi:DNA mismatch endonuclease (patch repair protein)
MKTGADPFSKEKRADVMRAVKGKNTKPELKVRAMLRELGYARRYRIGGAGLPGKPDIVFSSARKAIFVHGCFWHGHECARGARTPKANAAYWIGKIARNRARDAAAVTALGAMTWSALTIWECELRDEATPSKKLSAFLSGSA